MKVKTSLVAPKLSSYPTPLGICRSLRLDEPENSLLPPPQPPGSRLRAENQLLSWSLPASWKVSQTSRGPGHPGWALGPLTKTNSMRAFRASAMSPIPGQLPVSLLEGFLMPSDEWLFPKTGGLGPSAPGTVGVTASTQLTQSSWHLCDYCPQPTTPAIQL